MFEEDNEVPTQESKEEGNQEIVQNEDGSFVINGKKYNDIDAVIKAKVAADHHIDLIQHENKAFREQLESAGSTKELLETFTKRLESYQPGEPTPKPTAQPSPQPKLQDPAWGELKKELDGVKSSLKSKELNEAKARVQQILVAELGEADAKAAWSAYKNAPDFDEAWFQDTVVRYPRNAVNIVKGFKPQKAGFTAAGGGTPSRGPGSGPKGWSYYKALLQGTPEQKKEYKARYNEMMESVRILGREKFYAT